MSHSATTIFLGRGSDGSLCRLLRELTNRFSWRGN